MRANVRSLAGRVLARLHGLDPSIGATRKRLREERGATLVEYALLLALIAAIAIGSLFAIGRAVSNNASDVAYQLQTEGGQFVPPVFTNGTGSGPSYPYGAASFVEDSTGDSFALAASGSPNPKFTAAGLPGGVALSSAGVLTDTGTDATGSYTFTVTASNGVAPNAQQTFTLTVTVNANAPAFPSTASTTFTADSSTDQYTISASGTTPITFNILAVGAGQTWPIPGITYTNNNGSTAYLTDTGTDAIGTYTFTITATNGVNPPATQVFTLTVAGVAPVFTNGNGSGPNYPTGSTTFTADTSGESYTFASTAKPAATFTETATGTGQSWPAAGVTLSSGGVLTDTGTDPAGVYTFTVNAANGVNPNATQTFTLTITGSQAPAFTNGNFFTGYATGQTTFAPNSTTATYTFTASGAPAPTFTATGLPANVTLSLAGVLTDNGQAAGGPFTIVVTAQNGVAPNATQTFTLTIAKVAPAFTNGNFFTGYATGQTTFAPNSTTATYTFTASGAPAPTFTATGLPANVTLSLAGVLTDNGQAAGGPFTIVVTAQNGVAPNATQTFTLTIANVAPAFTNGNFDIFTFSYPTGDANFSPYSTADSYTFTASGAPTPTFSATTALPNGINLSPSGVLTDNGSDPPGTFLITVEASNGINPPATQAFTLTIGQAPAFTDGDDAYNGYATGSTTFTEGVTTNSYTFTASGDPAPAFTLTGAPAAISVNSSTGVMTFSGTLAPGAYHFTVNAINGVTPNDTQAFTLTMHAQQAPKFTNGDGGGPNYPTGSATFPSSGTGGTFTFAASGYPAPTFSATTPSGVTLSSAGVLTDSGAVLGIDVFTVTATNVAGTATQVFTLSIGTAPAFTNGNYDPTPHYSTGTTNFPALTGGTYTFKASGDPAPTFTAPTAPVFVSLTSAGVLTETTGAVYGSFTFPVTATNALGTASQTFTLTIGTAPAITSLDHAHFTADSSADTFNITATGEPAPTFTASAAGGGQTWPITGITLTNGLLQDTGTDLPGTYYFTITAANGIAPNDTQLFTLTVTGTAPAITSVNHATFTADSSTDSFPITATGNPAPTISAARVGGGQTWPITGITLTNGVLQDTGTDLPGTYTFTIYAANGVNPDAAQTFTLTVTGTAPAITSANTTTFTHNSSANSFPITATGNPAPTISAARVGGGQTWPITGITLTNGVLKDTGNDAIGTYTFTITAANGVAPNATQTFTLHVT